MTGANMRRLNRTVVGCLTCGVLGLVLQVGGLEAQEEAERQGLQAVLPDVVPDGLDPESFETLDGNWTEWSTAVSELVIKLYEEPMDDAGQMELLSTLQKKLQTMEDCLKDPRYAPIHDRLGPVAGAMARRLGIAQAVADSLKMDPEATRQASLDRGKQAIVSAVTALKSDLSGIPGGSPWAAYVFADKLNEAVISGDGLQEAVESSLSRLTGLDSLSDEQKSFMKRSAFSELAGALEEFREESAREVKAIDPAAVQEELRRLVTTLENYESASQIGDAAAAREAFVKLKGMLPDGGESVGKALNAHYLNYNLNVLASEELLSSLVGEIRDESGPVKDYVLGANVSGTQKSRSVVGIDLKPSADGALMDITVEGVIRSSTRGVTSEATIFTSGNHKFRAAKEVRFDGDSLVASPATINVRASNTTTGARTKASGVPLIGGLTEGIARSEARKRRSQSEAIARSRISDQVLPRFNKEVDDQIASANQQLTEGLLKRLRENNLFPSARRLATTDSRFQYSSRTMDAGELGAGRPTAISVPRSGLLLQVHETAINNALDRMELAGQTLSESELKAKIEKDISALLGREFSLGESESPEADGEDADPPSTFIFDGQDPIRLRFRGGELELAIRTGLKQEGKEDIPAQEISVPLQLSVEDGSLKLAAGRVRVSPVAKPESLQVQLARAGVIRKKIGRAIVDRSIDGTIEVERDSGEPVALMLQSLVSNDGWLSIALSLGE